MGACSRDRQNAGRLQRNERTCRRVLNETTARALCLLSCRMWQKNLPPTAPQKPWKQNVTQFRRDEGPVKSLKRLLLLPGFFFGTVILFRGYIRKTPLNYPLYALHYRGRFGFAGFPLRRPHLHSGALTSNSVTSGTRLSSR